MAGWRGGQWAGPVGAIAVAAGGDTEKRVGEQKQAQHEAQGQPAVGSCHVDSAHPGPLLGN
jgi:hypothetical protein